MRKHEIGSAVPEHWQSSWEGKFETFSHFEFAAGIPQVICAIATRKPNGKMNICLHAWNGFQGTEDAFRCYLPGLFSWCHTVVSLRKTPEFTVNFLSHTHMEALRKTISDNDWDADEFALAGFHEEPSAVIGTPRIAEAFLTLECQLEALAPLGNPDNLMAVGKVVHAAAHEGYMDGIDRRYGPEGFMFNIHSPQKAASGEEGATGVGVMALLEVQS
ncbi:MAG: flavin reductase [Oscillospiraceae bacterium]|nr:flavin reductase [Clostridia bacterium]MBQ9168189.1 flavin reductase [Oscillospiraceae bacterium]